MNFARALSIFAALACFTACGDAVPDAGAGGTSVAASGSTSSAGVGGSVSTAGGATTGGATTGGGGGASVQSPYANFATISEIVMVKCAGAGCHSGEMPPTMMADPALHGTLTTYVSKLCGNRALVKPGAPQESAFYLAQAGLCGDTLPRMPLGCVDTCVPAEYIEGVRQWIANGALSQ